MMMRRVLIALFSIGVVLQAEASFAAVLSLEEMDAFSNYLVCSKECRYGSLAQYAGCIQENGCGFPKDEWEKNLQEPTDEEDLRLAVLENWDQGAEEHICYIDNAVVPVSECGEVHCKKTHSAEECADADHDGLFLWQERLIGSSDEEAQEICQPSAGMFCDFYTECVFKEEIGVSLCQERQCDGDCTAFHLEPVVVNNEEVILHVYFDYSPVPPTVMDLFVNYSDADLLLLDARPLPLLREQGKEVAVSHASKGMLRLTILGKGSKKPIPSGAIVELVFNRISGGQSDVGFSPNDYSQQMSIAPDIGDELRSELRDDDLWGENITVRAKDSNGNRLLLYYSFDNARKPLDYADAQNGEELCLIEADCSQESTSTPEGNQARLKKVAALDALQRGAVSVEKSIEGVLGPGVFLDGHTNHLELPVVLNEPPADRADKSYSVGDQSFSLSMWMYAEGDFTRSSNHVGQVLFSHNVQSSENTRFGVLIQPDGEGKFRLAWFDSNVTDANLNLQPIASGLDVRVWMHLGVAVDLERQEVVFYLDGEELPSRGTIRGPAAPWGCPTFDPSSAQKVLMHLEGDIAGGHTPERLFFASSENNLYGIEKMDVRGMSRERVLRGTNYTAQHPDYSPIVDKFVYSSNESGDFEIWLANGDGSQKQQLTIGFGDTYKKAFALRPKWAPDASAIVFESNIYSIDGNDNWLTQGYRLFYLPYDPTTNTATVLDYEMLMSAQDLASYRLTDDFMDNPTKSNHTGAVWIEGRNNDTGILGRLAFNVSDENYDNKEVHTLEIQTNINDTSSQKIYPFGSDPDSDVRLLAMYWDKPAGEPAKSEMLLTKEWSDFESAADFEASVVNNGDTIELVVRYVPERYEPNCWDINGNTECDISDEDVNEDGVCSISDCDVCWDLNSDKICETDEEDRNGDGACTYEDCRPFSETNLFVRYDKDLFSPLLAQSGPGASIGEGQLNKDLVLEQMSTTNAEYIKIDIQSPFNNVPLSYDALVARIVFEKLDTADGDFELVKRNVYQELYIKDFANGLMPQLLNLAPLRMSYVYDAQFSRRGDKLVLAGIQQSRPVMMLLRKLDGVWDTNTMTKISTLPMRVNGLDLEPVDRYYPCNWVGAFKDPLAGVYTHAFRGGLDELKVYSYLREAGGFKSDAQRGRERLEKDGRQGPRDSAEATCDPGEDLDCPPYQLCDSGKCKVVPCDPDAAYPCKRGQCTLMPIPTKTGEETSDWVCTAECNLDAQCFEQECLNGPCRFCDSEEMSCFECEMKTDDYETWSRTYLVGCPDGNSFACEDGNCVTECYRVENGESKYLCDPALEYCKQGRCVTFDWDWTDFAPSTFSGLGRTAYEGVPLTTAHSQLYPIEIVAWGVEDYGHPPELLVEGMFRGEWIKVGQILVYNITKSQAEENPYVVYSANPLSRLRLRLVTPPYENLNAASTGLMDKDGPFCEANGWWGANDKTSCYKRASGSRANIGYKIAIPKWEVHESCKEKGYAGCQADSSAAKAFRKYLWGGQPAVVVTRLEVIGDSALGGNIVSNKICSYEGSTMPQYDVAFDNERTEIVNRKVFFGDVAQEISHQKERFFSASATSHLKEITAETAGSWAMLNCNYANRDNGQMAAVTIDLSTHNFWKYKEIGEIKETANYCLVETGDVSKPCYEWIGGDVALDYMTYVDADKEIFDTLDIDVHRSFGWDEESLKSNK